MIIDSEICLSREHLWLGGRRPHAGRVGPRGLLDVWDLGLLHNNLFGTPDPAPYGGQGLAYCSRGKKL